MKVLVCAIAMASQGYSQQDPAIPVGNIQVNQNMVRQGVSPILTWGIEYPTKVTDVITIDPVNEVIVTKTKLRVQVSVIGVGITDQYGREYPATSYIKFSSSGWKHIFSGRGYQVNPSQVLIDRVVEQGEKFEFAAKLDLSGYSYYYNNSANVRVLKNGDSPPTNAAGYTHQSSLEEFLRPYVKDGKLALGPLDIIYAAELTHSNQSHSGFDLQDTVVLVRFTKVE